MRGEKVLTAGLDGLAGEAFLRSLHISPRRDVVYVNNPKVASSTIKLALQRDMLDDPSYQPATSVHDHAASPLPRWPELTQDSVDKALEGRFVFSFVRCPFTRLRSAYLNKIMTGQKQGAPREHAGFDADEVPDFAAFITAVCAQDPSLHNPHWRAQAINLSYVHLSYDFIGRLENFEADWARLATQLGLPPMPERAGQQTGTTPDTLYTAKSAALVADAFAVDFETFGYDSRNPDKT